MRLHGRSPLAATIQVCPLDLDDGIQLGELSTWLFRAGYNFNCVEMRYGVVSRPVSLVIESNGKLCGEDRKLELIVINLTFHRIDNPHEKWWKRCVAKRRTGGVRCGSFVVATVVKLRL